MVVKVSRARGRRRILVSGKGFHVLLGHPKSLEKREDQLEGIPGPIARALFYIGQKIIVLAHPGEEQLAPGQELAGQFHGVVVFGNGTFAIGGKKSIRHGSSSLGRSALGVRRQDAFVWFISFFRSQPDGSANYMKKSAPMGIKFIFWQQFGKVWRS